MPKDEQKNVEEFKLSFVGRSADQGIMQIEDLTRSLEGWNCYWQTTVAVYYNQELSSKQLPKDIRPEIKIKAFDHGSFDVFGVVVMPLGLMVGYDIFKCVWKWQISVLKSHIRTKKGFVSRDAAITNLEIFAKTHGIKSKNRSESAKVLDMIDQDLNEFVEPIDRSAKEIVVKGKSLEMPLTVTSADKRALRSGYHLEGSGEVADYETCRVRFIRINTETGNALVEFEQPKDITRMGHQYARIIDPTVHTPRNIYTKALHEGAFINAFGKIVRSRISNKFRHWELAVSMPKETRPLLD